MISLDKLLNLDESRKGKQRKKGQRQQRPTGSIQQGPAWLARPCNWKQSKVVCCEPLFKGTFSSGLIYRLLKTTSAHYLKSTAISEMSVYSTQAATFMDS